jgi:hypothetical protein
MSRLRGRAIIGTRWTRRYGVAAGVAAGAAAGEEVAEAVGATAVAEPVVVVKVPAAP